MGNIFVNRSTTMEELMNKMPQGVAKTEYRAMRDAYNEKLAKIEEGEMIPSVAVAEQTVNGIAPENDIEMDISL